MVFTLDDLLSFPEDFRRLAISHGLRFGCGVPLVSPRGRLGVFIVGGTEDRVLAEKDARLLELVARQLAIAVENANQFEEANWYRREAAAQRDRLQLLLDLANAATSELDLEALLRSTSRLLREIISHRYMSVTLWDPEANQLRRHALAFPESQEVIRESAL